MHPTQSDIPAEALTDEASQSDAFRSHEFTDSRGTLYFAQYLGKRETAFTPEQVAGMKPRTTCPVYIIRRATRVKVKETGELTLVAYRKPFKGWKKRRRVAWTRAYRARALAAIAEQKAAQAAATPRA
jgi:hypothetical protein